MGSTGYGLVRLRPSTTDPVGLLDLLAAEPAPLHLAILGFLRGGLLQGDLVGRGAGLDRWRSVRNLGVGIAAAAANDRAHQHAGNGADGTLQLAPTISEPKMVDIAV